MLQLPAGSWVSVAAIGGPATVLAAPTGLAQEVLEAPQGDDSTFVTFSSGARKHARIPRDVALACLCTDDALLDSTRSVLMVILNTEKAGRGAWRAECAEPPRVLGA